MDPRLVLRGHLDLRGEERLQPFLDAVSDALNDPDRVRVVNVDRHGVCESDAVGEPDAHGLIDGYSQPDDFQEHYPEPDAFALSESDAVRYPYGDAFADLLWQPNR